MKFRVQASAELPFILNLSTQQFDILLPSGNTFAISVHNDRFLLTWGVGPTRMIAHGTREDLAAMVGKPAEELPLDKLRTVIEHVAEREVTPAELPSVSEEELVQAKMGDLVTQQIDLSAMPSTEELRRLAESALSTLTKDDRQAYLLHEQQQRYARAQFQDIEQSFWIALNRLIRWYSVEMDDFFVEEVSFHQLALTITKGILFNVTVDDAHLYSVPLVGKVPPLVRSPWLTHSPSLEASLKNKLSGAAEPDFARVLMVRARNLLERGAYRNAIAEAAAALEISVARAIRRAMTAKGKTTAEIDRELKDTNSNFPDRATSLLRKWAKKGVNDLDSALWTQIKLDRKSHRNAVVHSDLEPSETDARDIIERFCKMTLLVLGL